ncbi:MAG TPA: hypothetical protein VIU61_10980 [Kofleriaceae bacterium]
MLVILAIVLAGVGALGVRVIRAGQSALADGDAAIADQRPRDAIAAWEQSARWYFPAAPHVDDAYARLRTLAANNPRSLAPWYAIRRAALATRSLWTPHAEDLAAADAAIAKLASAQQEDPSRLAWHEAQLAAPTRPGIGSTVLAVLGIVAWLTGIGVTLRRGLAEDGAWIKRPALVGLGIAAAGIAGWAAGLYTA